MINIPVNEGGYIGTQIDSFNLAGKLEILASCTEGSVGNFYLYTIPDNWRSPENWERQTLAGNFQPVQSAFNPNTMAPGKFKIFYPSL